MSNYSTKKSNDAKRNHASLSGFVSLSVSDILKFSQNQSIIWRLRIVSGDDSTKLYEEAPPNVQLVQFMFTLDLNDRRPYPGFHIPQHVKSLPFHMTWSLKKAPFWADLPCIGHYREYPWGKRFSQGKYSSPVFSTPRALAFVNIFYIAVKF